MRQASSGDKSKSWGIVIFDNCFVSVTALLSFVTKSIYIYISSLTFVVLEDMNIYFLGKKKKRIPFHMGIPIMKINSPMNLDFVFNFLIFYFKIKLYVN